MPTMMPNILTLQQLVRAAKRITHAAGYLELGMIPQALHQLEGVENFGPFDAAADLIRGEAFRCQNQHEEAARWFRRAARKFANPLNQAALVALTHCVQSALHPQQSCSPGTRKRPPGIWRLGPQQPSEG